MTVKKNVHQIVVAFRAILKHTEDMIFVKDADLKYVAASMPFVRMAGKKTIDEVIGFTDFELFEDKDLAQRYVADDLNLLENGQDLIGYMEPLADANGEARYGSTSKHILYDEDGTYVGILGITRDITKEYYARQYYQQELQYLFEIPEDMYAVCYIDVDGWRMISQRRQAIGEAMIQNCHSLDELRTIAVEFMVDTECEAGKFFQAFSQQYLREIYREGRLNIGFEYNRYMTDGSIRWVRNEMHFLIDADSGHLCIMLFAKDVDARKKKEQALVKAAQVDRMTMLLNRETTMEQIQRILTYEYDRTHVLFMLDVDNFKDLNDTMGHQVGDEFLVMLTAEIRKCFRSRDITGRIGGDEFFVLMRDVTDPSAVIRKANELFAAIQKVCAQYPNVALSASMGISRYPEDGKTLKELYAAADKALYQAKRKGKNRFVFAENE